MQAKVQAKVQAGAQSLGAYWANAAVLEEAQAEAGGIGQPVGARRWVVHTVDVSIAGAQ